MNEIQIIQLCKTGHTEYFDTLIISYEKPLYSYCFHLCHNSQDASDLFQETWLKAFSRLETYNNAYSFRNWLLIIASNTYKDRYRKKIRSAPLTKNFTTAEAMEYEMNNIPSNQPTAGQILEEKEINLKLRVEIGQLKWRFKSVVVLHYFEDKSLEVIGKILGIPTGTVKSRLSKARKLLKTKMEAEL